MSSARAQATGAGARPIWDAWHAAAERHPERPALHSIADQVGWSYRELSTAATERADRFAEQGLRAGDTCVLALPNTLGFAASFLGLARLGATVVLASTRYGSSEVQSMRAQAGPAAWLVAPDPGAGYVELQRSELRWSRPFSDLRLGVVPEGRRASASLRAEPSDAVIKFTSGSTGEPKGIRLSADSVLAEGRAVIGTLGLGPADRVLALVPLSHSYGFDLGFLGALLAGGTLSFGDALGLPVLLRELELGAHTVFLGVPLMYRVLLEAPRAISLSSLRWLLSCTAPLSTETIAAFHAKFGVPICQHYGSSETGALTNHVPSEVMRRPDSVGRAASGVTLRVLDAAGEELPTGEEGEVVAESQAIATGYLREPEGRSGFRDGCYYTGDLGVLDADGFVTLRGRLDRVINVGGLKVSPLEVMRALEAHPAVREAHAYGAKNRDGEESVYAMVTLRDATAVEAELLRHCRGQLAPHKVPRRIEIREALPLGPTGKVRVLPGEPPPDTA